MKILSFNTEVFTAITQFNAQSATAAHLLSGQGPSHVYWLEIQPGGQIDFHEAGFTQLFMPLSGEAWVQVDSEFQNLEMGQAALIEKGEIHAKGCPAQAVVPLRAVMIQIAQKESHNVS